MEKVDANLSGRIAALVRRCFGPETRVAALRPVPGDASTRRYLRAELEGPAAPRTAVVMVLADRGVAMSSDELAIFDQPLQELPYVNVHHFLERIGVAVPALYADGTENGLLLLEDIGDLPLWEAVQGKAEAEVRALYAAAIDQLLTIQVDGTRARDERCIAFRQSFDARLFEWEFEHFLEYGFAGRLPAAGLPAAELAELRRQFRGLSLYLDAQPRVLNHRDYHSWNLFLCDGRVRVIDFQDALLAPAPYDLATLLGDRVTRDVVHPDLEAYLLDDYARGWAARGNAAWDRAELWEVYSTCALQKAFKVVGRFHYLDREKGKPGYLRYIPPTLRQIARLLDQRADLASVREILTRYFPEIAA
jgi:aminoglycoside/choline kinase family phosphotransferase